MKPLVGPPGCVGGCCCASRNLAWSCSQKAALPFFQVPPVFGVANGLMVTRRLLPLPWAAHGCSCNRYCSVTEIQSWKILHLSEFSCGSLNVKVECQESMRSPGDCPVSGQCGCS